jgi:dissimilatory sulfite reductase (desulfoviridin) alpha/beta subunit
MRRGNALPDIYSENEAMDIIGKAIRVYRDNGNKKERFGDMIDRIGLDTVTGLLLNSPSREKSPETL